MLIAAIDGSNWFCRYDSIKRGSGGATKEIGDTEVVERHEYREERAGDFEAGVTQALPLFARAKGCGGAELHRVIELENRYVLLVRWETVDDHMVHFRQSEDFQQWRALVGPHFARAPEVSHTTVA